MSKRTFCPEDGRACYTPDGPEPEGFVCANIGLCASFAPASCRRPIAEGLEEECAPGPDQRYGAGDAEFPL